MFKSIQEVNINKNNSDKLFRLDEWLLILLHLLCLHLSLVENVQISLITSSDHNTIIKYQ